MLDLPLYIPATFILTTLATLFLFHWVVRNSTYRDKATLISGGLAAWLVLQMLISLSLFYANDTKSLPPRFLLVILPPLLMTLGLFLSTKGRAFIDSLPLKHFTYLSIVRIPVEICLYWLAVQKVVPELMTFAGRNFDILAGITAPFVAYFGFQKGQLSKNLILIWNVISLGLLLFIIVNGILSSPLAIQQFAFDQPNIALLYFPFVWLPAFIVPIVLFGHFTSIRQLLK